MLYVLHGDDIVRGKAKLAALVESLARKKPNASRIRFDIDTFDVSRLDELISTQGLFEKRCMVVLDRVLADKDFSTAVLGRLKDLAASPNIIIVFEEKLAAPTKRKFERHAERVQTFAKTARSKDAFNVFTLTEALGKRDGRTLWVLYQRARMRGMTPEEIHGLLFWQLKSMMFAAKEDTPGAAGLKPFVFGKAKKEVENYGVEELRVSMQELVHLYHNARRGRFTLESALERFILMLSPASS